MPFCKGLIQFFANQEKARAKWQSGHAADCKSVYAGSIPTLASNARVVE